MQIANNQPITKYLVISVITLILFYLILILQKPIILSLLMIIGGICFLVYMLLPDKWIIYSIFLSYIFYFDFLFKGHDLFEAILPISFIILLLRRFFKKDFDLRVILKNCWPFLLYFAIGFYWFTQQGMAPTIITGKDVLGMGNFSYYYNIFLNMLSLLLPFIAIVEIEDFAKFLRVLLFLFIIQSVFLIFHIALNRSFYIPCFLPFVMGLRDFSRPGMSRIGAISNISYILILYTVFWGDNFQKYIKWSIISLALSMNIIWGGGRIDLICSVFILMFVSIVKAQKFDLKEVLKVFAKFSFIIVVILVFFNLLGKYILPKQQERFTEILNLKKAWEKRIGGENTRMEMWRYALQEGLKKPLFGNGISQYFERTKFQHIAYGNVATGGAHNKYVSIFYSFGIIGLLVFLWGSKKFFCKLFYLRKEYSHVLWNFLLMYFLIMYFIRFNLGGGIKAQVFIFYFFIGYILSFYRGCKSNNAP